MMVSIVIPAFNEEECIEEVVSRLVRVLTVEHEIIVVNDHSIDNTRNKVEGLKKNYKNIALVDNQESQGFANTLRAGFKVAKGDVVVPIMADFCDEPVTINQMYCKIEQGYDIVCGSRYMREGKKIGGPGAKTFLSSLAGKIIYILGIPTHDITNSFKMYKKEVIEAIDSKAKSFEISMEIPLKAYLKGFKMTEIPTVWHSRVVGESSFKVMKLIPIYLKLYSWAIMKNFIKVFSFKGGKK
ncbi:MAG: glycosyltransferase family 2 protein [Candidatus Omnitrophica bacterium]|nr:glycosyltransferase family 2 protein [Candidatus Omnitrophota bacterium]